MPEFVKLLDHPDKNVRYWGVRCLEHTVEAFHETNLSRESYETQEKAELDKWRKWWQEKGQAYMTAPVKYIHY